MSSNRVIGKNNQLPWHMPADLQHFKTITTNKPIIMGRKTYDSIGRALPNRRNLVVSRQAGLQISGCDVFATLEQAIEVASDAAETIIIGGATIYQQALAWADRLYLTIIQHEFVGDAYFPAWDNTQWQEIERHTFQKDERNAYDYVFITLQRNTVP